VYIFVGKNIYTHSSKLSNHPAAILLHSKTTAAAAAAERGLTHTTTG